MRLWLLFQVEKEFFQLVQSFCLLLLDSSADLTTKTDTLHQYKGKRPGKPFLPGSVVLSPVNSGLWAFSGEVSYERTGAGLA